MTGQHILLFNSRGSQGGQIEKLCLTKQKEEEEQKEEEKEEEEGDRVNQ